MGRCKCNYRCNYNNNNGSNCENNERSERQEKPECFEFEFNRGCGNNNNYMYGPYSNRIQNGDMELLLDMDNEDGKEEHDAENKMGYRYPNWDVTSGVERVSNPSLVHTGYYAAFLNESASMSQTLFRVYPSRQYEFSFFAKFDDKKKGSNDGKDGKDGKDDKEDKKKQEHKQDLGLKATVTFFGRNMKMDATEIIIPAGALTDEYSYYRAITPMTPSDVVAVVIRFDVSESQIRPHVPHHFGVLLDDVSFSRI